MGVTLLRSESYKNELYIYIYLQSGPTISGTGPDCGPKEPDHTVRSFLQSPFSSEKKTGLRSGGAEPYSPVFFNGLQIRPRSGPDRTVASLTNTHYTHNYQTLYTL